MAKSESKKKNFSFTHVKKKRLKHQERVQLGNNYVQTIHGKWIDSQKKVTQKVSQKELQSSILTESKTELTIS